MLSKIKFEWPLVKVELDVRIQVKEAVSPQRTIDWDPIVVYRELSISAEICRRSTPGARWRDSCFGQCRGEVREHADRLEGHQRDALLELLHIWERWHLNGLNAGMRPQRDALQSEARGNPGVLEYSAACKYLSSLDLLEYGRSKYTYGSAWLVEPLPEDVEQTVRTLCRMLGGRVLEAA